MEIINRILGRGVWGDAWDNNAETISILVSEYGHDNNTVIDIVSKLKPEPGETPHSRAKQIDGDYF